MPTDRVTVSLDAETNETLQELTGRGDPDQQDLLGEYTNGSVANTLGAIVPLTVDWFGIRTLLNEAGGI